MKGKKKTIPRRARQIVEMTRFFNIRKRGTVLNEIVKLGELIINRLVSSDNDILAMHICANFTFTACAVHLK